METSIIIIIIICVCISISSSIGTGIGVYFTSQSTQAPKKTTPAPTTPAPTTPASTTPASTTPASTTPASTTSRPSVNLTEGEAVQCIANDVGAGLNTAVYRYTGNKLRLYTDPFIADSWDPNWRNHKKIDCIGQTMGTPIAAKLQEGKAIQCVTNDVGAGAGTVYRYTNNQLRPYPDPTIASSWDPNWGTPLKINCIGQTLGTQMQLK